jgi:hypothetical protein
MGVFADELQAAMAEAARKVADALRAGDEYAADSYRERLRYLRRVAAGHGVEVSAEPADPAAARGEDASGPGG